MTDSAAANIRVEWNITLHRIFGWYGQEDLTLSLLATGLIGWNTYTHDAEVEGTIRIGDQVFELSRSSRYRAYGDQNFGKYFPVGSPEDKYNWGWYSVVLPNDDHSKEVSVIAGVGVFSFFFPPSTDFPRMLIVLLLSVTLCVGKILHPIACLVFITLSFFSP